MIGSTIRRFCRGIAMKLYVPKSRDRDERLSESGVFDFAFNNPTNREVVEYIGTSSTGSRNRYNGEQFASVNSIARSSVYRPPYMDKYIEPSDNEFIQESEALVRYVENEAIPKLVECRVLDAVVSDSDNEKVILSEVEELLETGAIKAYKRQYKSSGVFVPNKKSNAEIVGARPGARFDFAYDALKNIHLTDSSLDFAEGRI